MLAYHSPPASRPDSCLNIPDWFIRKASQVVLVVNNPPDIAGHIRDVGSIPRSRRFPGEGHGNSSIVAWRILWTEEPSLLQSIESQRVGHD